MSSTSSRRPSRPRESVQLISAGGRSLRVSVREGTTILGAFAGFERITDSDLPSEAALLVGHGDEMKKHFSYPARKPGP